MTTEGELRAPAIGINTATALEIADDTADGAIMRFGTEANMALSAKWGGQSHPV